MRSDPFERGLQKLFMKYLNVPIGVRMKSWPLSQVGAVLLSETSPRESAPLLILSIIPKQNKVHVFPLSKYNGQELKNELIWWLSWRAWAWIIEPGGGVDVSLVLMSSSRPIGSGWWRCNFCCRNCHGQWQVGPSDMSSGCRTPRHGDMAPFDKTGVERVGGTCVVFTVWGTKIADFRLQGENIDSRIVQGDKKNFFPPKYPGTPKNYKRPILPPSFLKKKKVMV